MSHSETKLTGGCYCGAVRYEISGKFLSRAQCHCRACQHISGGGPNYFALVNPDHVALTKGALAQFTRDDLDNAVTRSFCATCGTHVFTQRPGLPQWVLKIGTLDDPSAFKGPQAAIFTEDAQPFHVIPKGLPAFPKLPPR